MVGDKAIFTNDGYSLPLSIRDGLAYLDIRKPTDQEYKTLPHVILTSDVDWDPRVLDHQHNLEDDNIWYTDLDNPDKDEFLDSRFGEVGDYIVRNVTMELLQPSQEVTRDMMLVEETID